MDDEVGDAWDRSEGLERDEPTLASGHTEERPDINEEDAEMHGHQATQQRKTPLGQATNEHPETQPPTKSSDTISPPQEAAPSELFDAVLTAMKAHPQEQVRDEWLVTVAELFVVSHSLVTIDADKVAPNKKKYLKLSGEEKAFLFTLFREVCYVNKGSYNDWQQLGVLVTQDLYNMTWSFKTIMHSRMSKVKWEQTQPLNQWAAKVRAGGQDGKAPAQTRSTSNRYQPFMFNPACYQPAAI